MRTHVGSLFGQHTFFKYVQRLIFNPTSFYLWTISLTSHISAPIQVANTNQTQGNTSIYNKESRTFQEYIHIYELSSALAVITWAYEMGSHIHYRIKGIDVAISFRGFSLGTPSASSRDGQRELRRGCLMLGFRTRV